MTAENIPPVPATAEAARFPLYPGRRRPAVPSMRRPITGGGCKTLWRRQVRDAGIAEGFRRHDTRHTAGTRYVRATGNLKGAQKLLGHARIETRPATPTCCCRTSGPGQEAVEAARDRSWARQGRRIAPTTKDQACPGARKVDLDVRALL